MRIRFSRSADADLNDIFLYIAQESPRAAASTIERIIEATSDLTYFPMIGRPSGRLGERELTTARPYVIVYVVRADIVEVTRIHHGAQDR